ncbi:cupin domain-containing protein [Prosthecobacter sp.]|uniref:cupin domain-containing protein n=1 Tax=Prosthecobacter sp. TaxID=1965333 RepID=UPI0037847EB7
MNISNIRESTEEFHLLVTTGRSQTATMTLVSGAATSDEPNTHPHSDQVVLILEGEVVAEIGDERHAMHANDCVTIPAGVKHRFINEGRQTAFAFTVYGPPAYPTDDPA